MKTKQFALFAIILVIFASCKKDKPVIVYQPNPTAIKARTLLVGCEGGFGTNTASLTQINLKDGSSFNNVYQTVNGSQMGDVLQSITRVGESFYFVINNSNKIVVTDTNFIKKGEIVNVDQPRFLLSVGNNKAYVSSIYNYKIYIVDLQSNTKIGEIGVDSSWTEEMLLHSDATGDYVFVCNNDTAINYVTKINTLNDQIVGRITIGGYAPSRLVKDQSNNLWVLAGNNYYGKIATLSRIDLSTNMLTKTLTFSANVSADRLAINSKNDLFVLTTDYIGSKNGVYKINSNATVIPGSFFYKAQAGTFLYGLAVDPSTNDIFISDPKGFTQAGSVSRFNEEGLLLNSWITGIAPSCFYFVD